MYRITEYFSDGYEIYELTRELAIYVFGYRLFSEMLAGKWANLYDVEIIN